jgi:hypothetical protein
MDPFDYWIVNVGHYELWEKRAAKWIRRGRRRLTTWQARLAAWHDARRERAHARAHAKEQRRMPTVIEQTALYKATATQMDHGFLEWLKAQHRQEFLEDPAVMDEAVQRAKAELEEAFTKRQERLDDQYAKYRADLDNEVEERIEQGIERQRQDWLEEIADDLRDLRAERSAWKTRAETAEGMVADLFRQLCGGVDRKVYLRSGGRGLEALNKEAVNQILTREGLQLRSRATFSERLVAVRLDAQHVVGHSVFWLTETDTADAADEPAETEGPAALPEDLQANGTI